MEEELKTYLENIAKLLNGQIRGSIVQKAKEENLSLIQLTLSKVYNDAYQSAYNKGVNDTLESQIRAELKEEIKKEIEGN